MCWEQGLEKAFRYFDNNIAKMSRETGITEDRLDYLRNKNAKKMRLDEAIIIEVATEGVVLWHQLIDQADTRVRRRLDESAPTVHDSVRPVKKMLSERVYEAMMLEQTQCSGRQGQRTDLHFVPNYDEVTKNADDQGLLKRRTDEKAAKQAGMSRTKYRNAKKVLLKGTPELIQAMDEWLKPYRAVVLTQYSREKQQWILSLTRKEIIAYVKGEFPVIHPSPVNIT
jgi:hypothetical protein